MIALLKSTKSVLVDALDNIEAKPQCALITFTEVEGGFGANGKYFYEVEGQEESVMIRDFDKFFSNAEADALFNQLNIQYPEGATYSEMRTLEKEAALKYVVASENRFGLTIQDYE